MTHRTTSSRTSVASNVLCMILVAGLIVLYSRQRIYCDEFIIQFNASSGFAATSAQGQFSFWFPGKFQFSGFAKTYASSSLRYGPFGWDRFTAEDLDAQSPIPLKWGFELYRNELLNWPWILTIPNWFFIILLSIKPTWALVRRFRSHDHDRDDHARCTQCGYDLHGIGSPTCPECGHEIPEKEMPPSLNN